MKILHDHCVKKQLVDHFEGHEVCTTFSLAWHDLVKGQLLKQADHAGFDILVTGDKNMPFQSSLKGLNLCVAVLDAPSNTLADLIVYASLLLDQLEHLKHGEFYWIRKDLS